DARQGGPLLGRRVRRHDQRPVGRARRPGPRGRGEPRRQLDRPVGAPAAARAWAGGAAEGDPFARGRERRAPEPPRRRGHPTRSPRPMTAPGDVAWTPTPELREESELGRYLRWLRSERGLDFDDYDTLWRWSVEDLEGFWGSLWDFFEIRARAPYE